MKTKCKEKDYYANFYKLNFPGRFFVFQNVSFKTDYILFGRKKSKNEIKIKDVFKFCLQKGRKRFKKSCVRDIGYNKLNFLRCIIKSCVCVAVQIL